MPLLNLTELGAEDVAWSEGSDGTAPRGLLLDSGTPREQRAWIMPRAQLPGDCQACWKVLERFHWTAGLTLDSYGVRLGVRVTEAAWLEAVLDRFPPGWTPAPSLSASAKPLEPGQLYSVATIASRSRAGAAPYHYLYRGGCRLARVRDREELLAALESDLHLLVATRGRENLFVHAGAVTHGGRAILIPGRSFTGKTSLVAALVRAGAQYLSDEYAVFDPSGRVLPYAKRLSVRGGAGLAAGRYRAEDLGGRDGEGPVPVGMVVSTRYAEGARWRPAAMTSGQALLALLENAVQVREQPRLAMRTLPNAVADARLYRGRRGEAEGVAAWLLERSAEVRI